MKNLLSLLCAGACLSLPILMSIGSASAAVPGRGPIVKINGEGFRICRAFDANDTKAWTARANGLLIDGAGNGDYNRYFSVRTCFKTKAECQNFIDRIEHKIHGVDYIRYAGCKPRNS